MSSRIMKFIEKIKLEAAYPFYDNILEEIDAQA